jgi:hypothetical protein
MTEMQPSAIDVDDTSTGFKYRVVLLGEATVGKTSLLRRFTENVFNEEYKQTIGTTFASKDVAVVGEDGTKRNVRLVIWDMGGQATYRELRRQFMKGASAAIIAYDVTRPETFMSCNNLRRFEKRALTQQSLSLQIRSTWKKRGLCQSSPDGCCGTGSKPITMKPLQRPEPELTMFSLKLLRLFLREAWVEVAT